MSTTSEHGSRQHGGATGGVQGPIWRPLGGGGNVFKAPIMLLEPIVLKGVKGVNGATSSTLSRGPNVCSYEH